MTKLALFGGEPVRKKPFPPWPRPTSDLKASLLNTFDHEGWGLGSEAITRFEEAFAAYQDARYCISTNSGTTALWVALKAAGVKTGDEVIIPPYTFIATATAVLMANAVPVFVDVEESTFNLNPGLIEGALTSRTRVIMPVHIAGNPANMDPILALAKKHGLAVIEDAAQAHGAEWRGTKVGALGLGGIFSFQTSKNMTAGEGGAIVSNDQTFIEACFSIHNCGRVKTGAAYDHPHLGGNFRLNALAASLLKPQIDSLPADMDRRDRGRQTLDTALSELPGLTPLVTYPGTSRSANHLYICRYNRDQFHQIPRETFFKAMRAEGVFTYSGYMPLYREKLFASSLEEYPWLEGRDFSRVRMLVTEDLADRQAVWLKQNCLLGSERDLQDIINAFEKVTAALRNNPELFLEPA